MLKNGSDTVLNEMCDLPSPRFFDTPKVHSITLCSISCEYLNIAKVLVAIVMHAMTFVYLNSSSLLASGAS
jgi:hypothetical protein